MGLFFLLALQLCVTVGGFALLWRRLDRMSSEVVRLRAALDSRAVSQRRVRRAEAGGVVPIVEDAEPELTIEAADEGPLSRAARAWRRAPDMGDFGLRGPTLSPETGRGLVLAVMATAPAIGFFLRADTPAIIASGLAIGAAMMLVALRPMWRAAAWASVLTAGAWALLGFALAAAHAAPISYSVCVALAGAAGLAHAHLRRATPGATLALAMSAAVLALGSQTGMVGPAGAAFGAMVAVAAIIGAMSLRLEGMHLAAFGAALIGLFVLSGQDSAAIWFTPAATWGGALFLAIAAVRVPQLGARGAALAGTGMLAPWGVIAALHAAHQGLANAYAAAGAFVVLAIMLGGIIAVTALRRERGFGALRLTLWILTLGAFASVAGAIVLALPGPLVATAFAAFALGLVALDMRLHDAAWRFFAACAGAIAAAFAAANSELLLFEGATWSPLALIASSVALPAAISGASAFVAARNRAPMLAGFFELIAIALGVTSANLAVRLIFSGGAPLLHPFGFVEVGAHSVVWLAAALLIGSRVELGARAVRLAAINALGVMAFAIMAFSAGLWIAGHWKAHPANAAPEWLTHDTLGFLLPSLMFWANWVFWRARGDNLQTRLALGAGALLLAAFVTVETMRTEPLPDWVGALVGAIGFSLAIVINFAPGVTHADGPRGLDLEKNLHRDRRGQQRRQTR